MTGQPSRFGWLSTNTLSLLALGKLFTDISTEMLYPILPVLFTQTLHASGSIVDLVDGAAQATQNIVQGFRDGGPTNCKGANRSLLLATCSRR